MALSRIWSAFILLAISVASWKCFVHGDAEIFSRMVTGKASDAPDTVRYLRIYGEEQQRVKEEFIQDFGYWKAREGEKPDLILYSGQPSDSLAYWKERYADLPVWTMSELESRLVRPADGIIQTCITAVNICIGLIGIMALFMGLMSIAEQAGGIRWLSRIIAPFFSRLFPDLPKDHPAMGHMVMNFSANLLGLDNAATPFGLKAMQSLQELNPSAERASNAQIMFLCLHASGLTLIPVSIIAIRGALNAENPTDIFIPTLIATFMATMASMIIVSIKQRIRLFQPVILAWVGSISLLFASLVYYVTRLNAEQIQTFSGILSNGLILLIFFLIVLAAVYRKVPVFDAFVQGAKDGFDTGVRIIPYLVGMLVAISLLRTSGCFDLVIQGMKSLVAALGTDTRFVDGIPTALIRPLSGSGARGMMVDTIHNFGPDSFAGRLSSILQGSSDTTFYVVAVYFGSVGIRHTRYAIGAMLLADLVGVITAISMAYLFFG